MAVLDIIDALADLTEDVLVKRRAAGSYVNGRWVDGAEVVITISASVQPYRLKGEENWLLPEGDGATEYFRFFSMEMIKTAEDDNGTSSDVLVYDSQSYKVLNVKDYMLLGGYYESIAVRVA